MSVLGRVVRISGEVEGIGVAVLVREMKILGGCARIYARHLALGIWGPSGELSCDF